MRVRLGLTYSLYGDPGRPVISGWGVADPDFEIPRSAMFIVRNGIIIYAYMGDPPWAQVLAALRSH